MRIWRRQKRRPFVWHNFDFSTDAGWNRAGAKGHSLHAELTQRLELCISRQQPGAGKLLFIKMVCYACRTVKLPKESLATRLGNVGSELTGYAVLPKEYPISAMIKAHMVVAIPGYTITDGKAATGGYNHFLTVQELIDLVVFLMDGATTPAK